jgi:hypothetical protein
MSPQLGFPPPPRPYDIHTSWLQSVGIANLFGMVLLDRRVG